MSEISPKNVLIISQEQGLSEALLSIVLGAGYQAIIAHDTEKISLALSAQNPDLIILDIGISEVGGFPILEEIRTKYKDKFAQTPIIICSENGDLVEISTALKLGISDYFVKSTFSPENIRIKIMKCLGVDIEVKSAKPFVPISRMAEPILTTVPTPEQAPTLSEIRVLIIEDDKFLRDLATQKLSREGIVVLSAIDGEAGILVAEKELPNIILLDILLPGIDGFEVLRRIRANPIFNSTSIAMLSNFGQREDIEKAIAAGADQFLIKANYTLNEIVDEVKKISMHPRSVKVA